MKKIAIFSFFLSFAVLSCSKVEVAADRTAETRCFDARSSLTRSFLDGKAVKWSATDELKVFNDEGAGAKFTTSEEKIDGGCAKFSGEIAASSEYYALFPYSKDATINVEDKKITTVVPYSVTASVQGSFDSKSNIAVARTTDGTLSFKNVLSYIKIDLSSEDDVTEVVIRSKDATKYLSGKIEITVGEEPSVSVVDGIPFIILVPKEGESVIAKGVYYLPVIPASLTSGISVRVKKEGKLYLKESGTQLTASRNTPVALPKIATSDYEYYTARVISDGNTGIASCYREYGSNFTDTDLNLPNLGDNKKSSKWNLPGTAISKDRGGAAAYYIDGTATKRGPYLRINFSNSSKTNNPLTKADAVIFEYDAYGNSSKDPVVLRIQEYKVGKNGTEYGVIKELTASADALPAQEAYKDRYVSDKIVRPFNTTLPFYGLMLCCTKTATCDDLITKFSSTNSWGMSNLRIWVHENPSLKF